MAVSFRVAALLVLVSLPVRAQFGELDSPAPGAVTIEGSYVWDLAGPVAGAPSSRVFGQGLLDVVFGYEKESSAGSLALVLDLQLHHGEDPSLLAGDVQAFDNQAAPGFERIAELFAQYTTAGDRLRVKAGKMDANGEFAAPDNAGDFVNSSMGFSPAIAGMSTFPDNGLGAVLDLRGPRRTTWRAGVFDAGERADTDGLEMSFDQVTLMVEAGRAWPSRGGGRLGIGWWRLDASGVDVEGDDHDGVAGVYLTFDQTVWMPAGDTDGRGVSFFAQWARTQDGIVEVDGHWGAGLQWTGPWASRPADAIGLGWTRAVLDRRFGFTAAAETAVEAFYRFEVGSGLVVQPDLQFIVDAGGDAQADAVVATTLRLVASF